MRRMPVGLGGTAGLFAVAALLAVAGPSQAHHVAGATYSGSYDGGRVEFDVSPDGTQVTRFKVYTKEGGRLQECYEGMSLAIPISDHAFGGRVGPRQSVSGVFAGTQSSRGTFAEDPPADGPRRSCLGSRSFNWTATVDDTGPVVRLGGSATQSSKRGKIAVVVTCPQEACDATVHGKLAGAGPGAARRFKRQTTGDHVFSGFETTLRLPITRRTRRAIERALRLGKDVTAEIIVTARDAAGNDTVRRRTIHLEL